VSESTWSDRVGLQEPVELGLVTPGAIVVIVANLASRHVDEDGIGPVGQPNDQPADLAAEEFSRAGDRRRQLKAATCGADGRMVAQFGLDSDDVGQSWVSDQLNGQVSKYQ